MRKVPLSAISAFLLAAWVMTAQPAQAAGSGRCDWVPRSVAVAAAPATNESRVADWIVARILKLAADSGPVVDISPAEVAAATGIDVRRVDADEVGQQVRERLRELSRHPVLGHPSAPASPAAQAAPEPEPAGAPAETTRGVPEMHN